MNPTMEMNKKWNQDDEDDVDDEELYGWMDAMTWKSKNNVDDREPEVVKDEDTGPPVIRC